MAIGHKLGLRLFLEGIEVPVIGASVSVVPDAPAAASIQVIATNAVLDLLPRTLVHLFFYDFVDATSPVSATGKAKGQNLAEGNSGQTPLQSAEQTLYDQYKILFIGEVQGIQFAKDAGNRSVVLSCVDLSNYWDTTYQYNFNGSIIGGRREAAFIGANANLFTSPLGHGEGTISRLLASKSVNFPKLRGLLAGIIRVLEAIGGSYYSDDAFKGANDFTSIAELRLKILQQITAAEDDTSTAHLFSEKTFGMWMNREIGSLGKLVTFRGLVQLMQRFIYHEVYPCPASMFVPEVSTAKTKNYAINIGEDARTKQFVARILDIQKSTERAKEIFSLLASSPSTSSVSEFQATMDHARSTYGTIVNAGVPKISGLGLEADVYRIDRFQREVMHHICVATGWYVVDVQKLGVPSNKDGANAALQSIIDVCQKITGYRLKRQKQVTETKVARLNNQIFRPDIWYAAPPRCNVIFPEMYNSLQWSRNFMREVSRLELQTTNQILGDDALFNGRYYAPDVADMRAGLRLSSRKFNRLIMQHELYTGIIPMYEKMTELNLFAMKATSAQKSLKVGYAQRAVNHQYFKHRFESRQMQCTGRFNPWFVPGFPALIIDRPLTKEQLYLAAHPDSDMIAKSAMDMADKGSSGSTTDMLRQIVGPQYVGTCVQLVHNVSQQGGVTSYTFAQARVHREDAEFLGVDKALVSKKVGNVTRRSVIYCLPEDVPQVGGKGPFGGIVSQKPKDVSNAYVGKVDYVWPTTDTRYKMQKVSPDGPPAPHAYEVKETVTRRIRVKTDLPIEEAVRPPWIWEGWTNLQIGDTYTDMIGVDSIVDVEGYDSSEGVFLVAPGDVESLIDSADGLANGTGTNPTMEDPDPTGSTISQKAPYQQQSDLKASDRIRTVVDQDRTIEACTDLLVRIYSAVRESGLDVGSFIRNYTWRPVATMTDILGSPDLQYGKDAGGNVVVTQGREGFHSRAFGNVSNLFGLVNPRVTKVLGLSKAKEPAAAVRLDVRAERHQAVLDYVIELNASKGLLG